MAHLIWDVIVDDWWSSDCVTVGLITNALDRFILKNAVTEK